MADFEAICNNGHRTCMDLRGTITTETRGRCKVCGASAMLLPLEPITVTGPSALPQHGWSQPFGYPLTSGTTQPLKFMAPGHFCPDVCDLDDFGEADYWRGRVVRAFFFLMAFWPKPTSTTRRLR